MRVRLLLVFLLVAVSLAACGSSKSHGQAAALENSAQTKSAETTARQIGEACVNKGGGLTAMFHCAIPPHHGLAFLKCAMNHAPKTVAGNDAGIETDLVTCGEKYR